MASSEPVFFELSWSILSTIGAANVFFGFLVVSVTDFTLLAAVPIIASAAGAVANGLCFYAFYLTAPPATNRAVASAFADIAWLVQEAGLSLYSYFILRRILCHRPWYIFAALFWTILLAITVVRIMIAVTRVRFIVGGDAELQNTVNHLHMAYFPLIALLECVSAYYLLASLARANISGFTCNSKTNLFTYLMCSTEVRLALLAVIGTMRAATYSFQVTAQSATHIASQVDRFCYTMECLFPIIMYIDMLSSKVVYSNQHRHVSLGGRLAASAHTRQLVKSGNDSALFHNNRVERIVVIHERADSRTARTGSQEHIVSYVENYGMAVSDVELRTIAPCKTR
ncbi:hypothetical protein QBC44DRAFT_385750 [Cladorrhinum sp. PSN332]|nr:hypothetical protein QBC44DRAFT_385750 [Cladorrhinum sp. PSN332]